MREEELKFSVHGLFVLPDLVDEGRGISAVETGDRLSLRATYLDTADLALAREGITLRHRAGEGAPTWHLKLPVPGAAASVRDELAAPGTLAQLPPELADLLTAWLRGATAAPVAVLRTAREVHRLRDADGTELAELVDDTVSVLEGRRVVSRFREIEVERRAIDDDALAFVAEQLEAAGAVGGEFMPKVVRALGPRATIPGAVPEPPAATARGPAADVVRQAVRNATRRLLAADVPVRRDEHDAVHQMRVACRRLRSDLRTFGPLVDADWADGLRVELAWLAGALGAARDVEVLRKRVSHTAHSDPLSELPAGPLARLDVLLERQQDDARRQVMEALRSPRYTELLRQLVAAAEETPTTGAAEGPASVMLPPLVAVAWGQLVKRVGKLEPLDPDDPWHRARILAKRARYAAEAVAPALGKDARKLASTAAGLQETLGEHQDAAVAADAMLALAAEHPKDGALGLVAGRLAERERAAVHANREDFPALWKRSRKEARTGWLTS